MKAHLYIANMNRNILVSLNFHCGCVVAKNFILLSSKKRPSQSFLNFISTYSCFLRYLQIIAMLFIIAKLCVKFVSY